MWASAAKLVFLAILIACPIVIWFAYVTHHRFFAYLRQAHPAIWNELDSSSTSSSEPEAAATPESAFLGNRRYLGIPDPRLHALGDRARALSFASVALLLAAAGTGLLASMF